MAKFLAWMFLLSAQFLVSLGNYWFTFGLWPQSWGAFFGFYLLSLTLLVCQLALNEAK